MQVISNFNASFIFVLFVSSSVCVPFSFIHCDAIDRNSSKRDTFHKPTTYEPNNVKTNSEQKMTFAGHEYGRVEVFRIKNRLLVQKL